MSETPKDQGIDTDSKDTPTKLSPAREAMAKRAEARKQMEQESEAKAQVKTEPSKDSSVDSPEQAIKKKLSPIQQARNASKQQNKAPTVPTKTTEKSKEPSNGDEKQALTPEQIKTQEERFDRLSKRALDAIIKAMPKLIPSLQLSGNKQKVAHKVDISGLDSFDALISTSYVVVKGQSQRTIYFAMLNTLFYQRLKLLLETDQTRLEKLTKETLQIQFACPGTNEGILFKGVSKGFLRGQAVDIHSFPLKVIKQEPES